MDLSYQHPNSQLSSSQSPSANNLYKLISVSSTTLPYQLGLSTQTQLQLNMVSRGVLAEETVLANRINSRPREEHKMTKDKSNRKSEDARTYKCNKCCRSYLSYPALYTHTKLKHMYTGENASITNGRMRGRPRKLPVMTINIHRLLMVLKKLILLLLSISVKKAKEAVPLLWCISLRRFLMSCFRSM
jgi:hypothetical protein